MGERLSKADFKKNGIVPESEFRRTLIEGMIKMGASEVVVAGQDNIAKVKSNLESGIPTIGIGNHLSNADGPMFNSVLGKAGIKDPVFVLGYKLLQNPLTNVFSRSADIIPVWPPSLAPKNAKEEELKKRLNEDSAAAYKTVLSGGRLLIVFPEGGRSYSGKMQPGLPQVGSYFSLVKDLEVFPMAIWETEKRLPRKRGLPHRGPVYLSFGKTFKAESLSGFGERGRISRQKVVDEAMKKVAELLPEKYQGYYGESIVEPSDNTLIPGLQKAVYR